ncbi:Uncharacterized protein conserved in bacteria [Serratia quinivorans]|uniref:Uncharacterized protein conserved in bacteria n=1 Tax=Serratia quinivorans TaxID=137545 RepID=A0A379YKZ0_9GAMM|nr:Uncharacterized protein conserved in bacteria [Serratia quinivorans]
MHRQVLDFWFDEIEPALWFKKDDEFDRLLHTRFGQNLAGRRRRGVGALARNH